MVKRDFKLAIMQPYFLPYIGYYQLIAAADLFIVYDNIKYTKKGWINRNRLLRNGSDAIFSLALKKDSDFLNVIQRELAEDFDRSRLLNQFRGAYSRAPYFRETFPLLENVVLNETQNLFHYIYNAILRTCEHIGITTEIRISSEVAVDEELKNQDKIIALCKTTGASTYINAIGGVDLYSRKIFEENGIDLKFIKSKPIEYRQFDPHFVPWLSIIDVLMFNPLDAVRGDLLPAFDLIENA